MRGILKKGLLTAAFIGASVASMTSLAVVSSSSGLNSVFSLLSIATLCPSASLGLSTLVLKIISEAEAWFKRGISLTKDEKEFAKSIFGEQLNIDIVRKRKSDKTQNTEAAWVGGPSIRIINVFNRYWSNDYSREDDHFKYGLFIHEMTHIWQNQNYLRRSFPALELSTGLWLSKSKREKGYPYKLVSNSKFLNFGIEQQASMVEDYTCRFLFPGGAPSRSYETPQRCDTAETDALLQKVVEAQFPAARQTRLNAQAQQQSKNITGSQTPSSYPKS